MTSDPEARAVVRRGIDLHAAAVRHLQNASSIPPSSSSSCESLPRELAVAGRVADNPWEDEIEDEDDALSGNNEAVALDSPRALVTPADLARARKEAA